MKITYLGHAGFCVETPSTLIIMDPWLSKSGAFDSAWFQYPQNHHLADYVRDLIKTSKKDKYIYISHEHQDHFDINFLKSLESSEITFVLADFVHPVVKNIIIKNNCPYKKIISLKDNEELHFKDGLLTLFVLDMELDCDSAILVKTQSRTFLNLNDCKIHERLSKIAKKYGPIDIFAAQFSGAVWHPTCYVMDEKTYRIICLNKNKRKFEIIAKALEIVKPTLYIPSAGPPCFLDPMLFPINFQEVNTYPRAPQLIENLNKHFRKKKLATQWPEVMPGDILDAEQFKFTYLAPNRIKDDNFQEYIQSYAKQYEDFFEKRSIENSKVDPKQTFINLKQELLKKLSRIQLIRKNIPIPLYFSLSDYKDEIYRIDFQKNTITITTEIAETNNFYSIQTPAWQINKVITGELKWPDFALTFRATLQRVPDVYNTLMHGFVTLEEESLERFCKLFYEIFSKKERINVVCKGKTYSVLRYCPHQGGDLLHAWTEDSLLVCPRHQWKFDLENHGRCRYNDADIDAICLSDLKRKNASSDQQSED